MKIAEKMRQKIVSWLKIVPAEGKQIDISEILDFQGNCIRNRIWYRGDSDELSQLYRGIAGNSTRFWKAHSTKGHDIRKLHSGIPSLTVDTLSKIIAADMNDVIIDNEQLQETWNEIAKATKFADVITDAIREPLIVGDGAFKITIDTDLAPYPLIEFVPGDKCDIEYKHGICQSITFKTEYLQGSKTFTLLERYADGSITYRLVCGNQEYPLTTLEETALLQDVTWDKGTLLAYPLQYYKSKKYPNRGGSIYDTKIDVYDSLDESLSQWIDSLRKNRTKEYIPDSLLPRDPDTGVPMKPNAFDNSYIAIGTSMEEGAKNEIKLSQGTIPHDSYLATYITFLDLALQGIISPSTLGIDTKKLDNAEAQREKEKTTLYTRNDIICKLQDVIPQVVDSMLKANQMLGQGTYTEAQIDATFGEYANPSFESVVETVSKGVAAGVMSLESAVDELYGDTRDDEWKEEEVQRIKDQQGITSLEEPDIMKDVEVEEEDDA